MPSDVPFLMEHPGVCPICTQPTTFKATHKWLRDSLRCAKCNSIPRERAMAVALDRYFPRWRNRRIHEGSPSPMPFSSKLRKECKDYVPSQYDPSIPWGSVHPTKGYRSEDLQAQTFSNEEFDLVVTLDVFEHILRPDLAIREIARTLRPGGAHVCTVPLVQQDRASRRRAALVDGEIQNLMPAEFHGNPMGGGSLVTVDWGFDIAAYFAAHSGLVTTIVHIDDIDQGIRGELTEVLVCRRAAVPAI